MPEAIKNQIFDQLIERMKNIVDGIVVRYTMGNKNLIELWTSSGSFALDAPAVISAEVLTDGAQVEFTYKGVPTVHDFSVDADFVLFDTGYTLTITDTANLYDGDLYDIRCNNSTISALEVRDFMATSSESAHPFIQIVQAENEARQKPSERIDNDAEFEIQIEADFELINTSSVRRTINEMIADIKNEIQRDPRLHTDESDPGSCLAINSFIERDFMYSSKANTNLAGAFLFLKVHYRTNRANARQIQP